MLAFPSYGPESLSRVLIEAAALGAPIAAMNTGGTRDIIDPGVTGLLSDDVAGFARDLADASPPTSDCAARSVLPRAPTFITRFSSTSVVERVEQVYRSLLLPRAGVMRAPALASPWSLAP